MPDGDTQQPLPGEAGGDPAGAGASNGGGSGANSVRLQRRPSSAGSGSETSDGASSHVSGATGSRRSGEGMGCRGRADEGSLGNQEVAPFRQVAPCSATRPRVLSPLSPPMARLPSQHTPAPPPATYADYSTTSRRTDVSSMPPPLTGRSLWVLSEDNLLRLWLYDTVTSKPFDYVMFFLIMLNCVAMAYEHPRMDPDASDSKILHWRCGVLDRGDRAVRGVLGEAGSRGCKPGNPLTATVTPLVGCPASCAATRTLTPRIRTRCPAPPATWASPSCLGWRRSPRSWLSPSAATSAPPQTRRAEGPGTEVERGASARSVQGLGVEEGRSACTTLWWHLVAMCPQTTPFPRPTRRWTC